MILTYLRPVFGIPVEDQAKVCRPLGMKEHNTYTDTAASFPQDRGKLIGGLRLNGKGDTVLVSDLVVLVANRKDLREVRSALRNKMATILEGRTGRRSTSADDLADMIQDAIERWSHKGRRWSNKAAQAEDASKGGKALARKRAERRSPKGLALRIWRDARLDTEIALAKINATPGYDIEWTRTNAYRHLGPRKIPTGPKGPR